MQFYASKIATKINTNKTKLLTAGFLPSEKQLVVFNLETTLKEIDWFKYFGFIITATGQREEDILKHINNTRTIFC